MNIIQPQDFSKIVETLIKSPYPPAIIAGLDFLSKIKNPESIPGILPLLDYEKVEVKIEGSDHPEVVKLEIKFKTLLTLATVRNPYDKESLEIVKKEINFWKKFFYLEETQPKMALPNTFLNEKPHPQSPFLPSNITYITYIYGRLYKSILEILPKLENYVEECELAIWEKSRAKTWKLNLNY